MINSSANGELVPTFGFVPKTFPRDPLHVNQFAEHMLLGQILLPLIDTDLHGNTEAAIAKKWQFDQSGKVLNLELDPKVKFSNGHKVTTADVKYSIERHMINQSQSSGFLSSVESIKIINEEKLSFILKRSDVSLIKALSRDHLGIVPSGWTFDSQSTSPFIGAGAYNLIKENENWFLVANKYYSKISEISIKKARLVFFTDDSLSIDLSNMPDIVPLISMRNIELGLVKNPSYFQACTLADEMTFSQSTMWWNPRSKFFKDFKTRTRVLHFLDNQVLDYSKKKELKLATGFIPIGVSGYIAKRVTYSNSESSDLLRLKISMPKALFEDLFSSEKFLSEAKKNNLNFQIQFINALNVKKMHEEFLPDITVGSWGGGFNDPTGFLGPLEEDLGMSFPEYLGSKKSDFLKAQSLQDWIERAKIFNQIAMYLIKESFMLPAFKNDQFSCTKKPYIKKEVSLRYTPRLLNYKVEQK